MSAGGTGGGGGGGGGGCVARASPRRVVRWTARGGEVGHYLLQFSLMRKLAGPRLVHYPSTVPGPLEGTGGGKDKCVCVKAAAVWRSHVKTAAAAAAGTV